MIGESVKTSLGDGKREVGSARSRNLSSDIDLKMSDMGKCALLERWKQIEELDVLEGDSANDDDNFKQSKEDW